MADFYTFGLIGVVLLVIIIMSIKMSGVVRVLREHLNIFSNGLASDFSKSGFKTGLFIEESQLTLKEFNKNIKKLSGLNVVVERHKNLIKISNLFPSEYQKFMQIQSFPSIFLGIGILGTFVGLTFGLFQLSDFTDSDTLLLQVQGLISGMRLAFVTSVIGMFSSIISTGLLGASKRKISQQYNLIIKEISEAIPYIDKLEYYLAVESINKGEELPTYTRAIDALIQNVELNGTIAEATTAMNNDLATSIANGIAQNIEPTLDTLNNTIEGFVADNKHGAQDTITRIIENLETSMREMVMQFKDMISSDTKNELEAMAKMLSESGEYFVQIPLVLEEILMKIEAQQTKQIEHYRMINENVDESIEMFNGEVNRYNQSIEKFDDTNTNFTSSLKQMIAFFEMERKSHGDIERVMNTFSSSLSRQSHSINETLEGMSKYLNEINTLGNEIDGVFRTVNSNINHYESSVGGSLNRYLDSYSEAVEQFTDKLETAVNQIQGLLNDIDDREMVIK